MGFNISGTDVKLITTQYLNFKFRSISFYYLNLAEKGSSNLQGALCHQSINFSWFWQQTAMDEPCSVYNLQEGLYIFTQ